MINTLVISGGVAAALLAGAAFAQTAYPTKPIRVINPFPPGGSIDVVARPVFDRLRGPLGQPLVMDFRPGGGTLIGASLAAKSPPDGYTLYAAAGQHAIIQSVYRKLPFDVVRDFAAVVNLATGPYLLVVHPSVPAQNVRELIALLKASPGKYTFGSSGIGGASHLAMELFKSQAGVELVHVPYKGGSVAINDLIAGQIALAMGNLTTVQGHVRTGRLRALAIGTRERSALLPDLPTLAEAGVPGYEANNWNGIVVPAATPRAVIARLHAEVAAVLNAPGMRERLQQQGFDPIGDAPEAFAAYLRAEQVKWARVVKASGAKAE